MADDNVPTPAAAPPATPAPAPAPTPTPAAPAPAAGTTNGTAARLCTLHKNPNTEPTPGANYAGRTPEELAKDLNAQADYACNQWKAGQGVVGPVGSESGALYSGYNNPQAANYERYQAFGYQHDLQATDAAAQVPPNTGPDASWSEWAAVKKRQAAYKAANASSATQGMYVLETTGDLDKALKKTQEVFRSYGFEVRQSY
jgi:hypothetical protein